METSRPTEAILYFQETLELIDSQSKDRSGFRASVLTLIDDLTDDRNSKR